MKETKMSKMRIHFYLVRNILIKSEIQLNTYQKRKIFKIIENNCYYGRRNFSCIPRMIFYGIGVQVKNVYFRKCLLGYIICIRAPKSF